MSQNKEGLVHAAARDRPVITPIRTPTIHCGTGEASARGDILAGQTYEAWWPFKRVEAFTWDEEGGCRFESWAPGWDREDVGPEDTAPVWSGSGAELRTVVSVFKPGRYPERVFYTRQWRDPAGKIFGRDGLRITTAQAFRRWAKGGLRDRLAKELRPWNPEAAEQAIAEMLSRPNGGLSATTDNGSVGQR